MFLLWCYFFRFPFHRIQEVGQNVFTHFHILRIPILNNPGNGCWRSSMMILLITSAESLRAIAVRKAAKIFQNHVLCSENATYIFHYTTILQILHILWDPTTVLNEQNPHGNSASGNPARPGGGQNWRLLSTLSTWGPTTTSAGPRMQMAAQPSRLARQMTDVQQQPALCALYGKYHEVAGSNFILKDFEGGVVTWNSMMPWCYLSR